MLIFTFNKKFIFHVLYNEYLIMLFQFMNEKYMEMHFMYLAW